MSRAVTPSWAAFLTDDDEWVVRTALANVAADLDRVSSEAAESNPISVGALRESAARYRETLARIELAGADE